MNLRHKEDRRDDLSSGSLQGTQRVFVAAVVSLAPATAEHPSRKIPLEVDTHFYQTFYANLAKVNLFEDKSIKVLD